jgi:hypothetical protein
MGKGARQMTDEQYEELGLLIDTKDIDLRLLRALDEVLQKDSYNDTPEGWGDLVWWMKVNLPNRY